MLIQIILSSQWSLLWTISFVCRKDTLYIGTQTRNSIDYWWQVMYWVLKNIDLLSCCLGCCSSLTHLFEIRSEDLSPWSFGILIICRGLCARQLANLSFHLLLFFNVTWCSKMSSKFCINVIIVARSATGCLAPLPIPVSLSPATFDCSCICFLIPQI